MSNEDHINNAHDKLFKSVFKVKEVVVDLLIYFFPKELTAQINLELLKLDDTSYVSNEAEESLSDVVYKTVLNVGNRLVTVVFLFEHKLLQPKYIEMQLLDYINGIWQRDLANKRPPSLIIPIVFYQGKTKWKRKAFYNLMPNVPVEFREFIPTFNYHLVSVHQTSDEIIMDLSKEHLLGTLLLMYKKVDDREFNIKNPELFFKYFENHPEKENLYRIFVRYYAQYTCLDKDEISNVLDNNFSEPILKSNIMTAYEYYVSEGIKKGKAEGEAEGIKKSISRLLLRGKLSIPEIAETMEVGINYVVEIRDELLRNGARLMPLVKDF